MSRLIDADAMYKFIQDQMEKETGAYTRGKNKAFNIVKSALHNECATPTIDAVLVVRCRECKLHTSPAFSPDMLFCQEHGRYVYPDGYCYMGERKEGAD